jgi:hypothetical protein
MNTTIAVTKEVTTLINILTVGPENQPKLIELLRGNTENIVSRLDGWISTSFIAGKEMPGTVLGHLVAAAYAEIEGVSAEEHVMQRYGSILRSAEVGERVAELLADPRYVSGVAYGFRAKTDIMPLDVCAQQRA